MELGGGRWINTRTERDAELWLQNRRSSQPPRRSPSARAVLIAAAVVLAAAAVLTALQTG